MARPIRASRSWERGFSGQQAAFPHNMADSSADRLEIYNRKRDFSRTAEPEGRLAKAEGKSFVIQKHAARRLHWDFRLEIDGVLVSWAVPKGPSLDPAEKRLAVRTEDHPLAYGGFEGDIPKGEYGGGHVDIWDEGSWDPIGLPPSKQLKKGHLHFRLDGVRLKGEWNLVRMHAKPGERAENWLLIKVEDDVADPARDVVAEFPGSVRVGEKAPATEKPKPAASRKRNAAAPAFRPLQLATLVEDVPEGDGWLHEMKYDGYRCLLAIGGGMAHAFTRSGLDWSDRFSAIVEAAAGLDVQSALLDGEVVVLDQQGRPDFAALQAALKEGSGSLLFMAFDLLELDGQAMEKVPQLERKHKLCALLDGGETGFIRYADHVVGSGQALFDTMCSNGLEGIVSKRCDAPYRGERTTSWVKVKCALREEFIIAGWTSSPAAGRAMGALALAQFEGDRLVYRGRVGTGFDHAELTRIEELLSALPEGSAPEGASRAAARGVHWVAPELVAEIDYATRTADGLVRHARYIGLRSDKPAVEVHAERAIKMPIDVTITHPERVVFPDTGTTKGEVAAYYEQLAELMLPSLGGRPISLIRCPDGIASQCFFQRHDSGALDTAVHHVDVADSDGKFRSYIYVDDAPGLLACVQMGTIEFHGWGAKAKTVESADRIVFDLDPDEGMGFPDVRKAAQDIRAHLETLGLKSRPMLSGGKGIHVIVPLDPPVSWETVKAFARGFAQTLSQAEPDRFVATASKAKRKGRIFIDWLRNQKSATSVEPYSLRARPGAPVAAPIDWRELSRLQSPQRYTIKDAKTLVARAGKLTDWAPIRQSLPA